MMRSVHYYAKCQNRHSQEKKREGGYRCQRCPDGERAVAETKCKTCSVYLCKGCVGLHVSRDLSVKHDLSPAVAPYGNRTSENGGKCCCRKPACAICGKADSPDKAVSDASCTSSSSDQREQRDILHVYNKIISNLEVLKARVEQSHFTRRSTVLQFGKDLHKTVDTVIENYRTDANQLEVADLEYLQSEISNCKKLRSALSSSIKDYQDLIASTDSASLSKFHSQKEDPKVVSRTYDITVPPFNPVLPTPEMLREIIGNLSRSVRTEIPGETITLPSEFIDTHGETNIVDKTIATENDTTSGSLSSEDTDALLEKIKAELSEASIFLDVPKVLNIVRTGFRWTYKVESGLNTKHFYVSGSKNIIKHMDTRGTLLDEIGTESNNVPRCFTVNKKGYLLYSDSVDRSINIVRDGKVKCLTKLGGWKPQTICSTFSDELLVGLKADDGDEAKVVRYVSSKIIQEIQFDDKGQGLYQDPHYIDENKNFDIIVSDLEAKAVVVVDRSGQFRFSYQGFPCDKLSDEFGPRGVTTDSLCQILVADFDNNLIHVIDKNGQFLRFIENCGLHLPLDLSVNSDNILFVVEYYSNRVKEVQYLK